MGFQAWKEDSRGQCLAEIVRTHLKSLCDEGKIEVEVQDVENAEEFAQARHYAGCHEGPSDGRHRQIPSVDL